MFTCAFTVDPENMSASSIPLSLTATKRFQGGFFALTMAKLNELRNGGTTEKRWRVVVLFTSAVNVLIPSACCNYTVRAKVTMRISTCFHVGCQGGIDLAHICLIAFEQTGTWRTLSQHSADCVSTK